jgi:hypothetical protein
MKPNSVSVWAILGSFLIKIGLFIGAAYFLLDVYDSSKKLIFGNLYQGTIDEIMWVNKNSVRRVTKNLQYQVKYACQKRQPNGFIVQNCYLETKDTNSDLGKKIGEPISVFRISENYDEKAVIFNNNFTDYLNVFIIPIFFAALFLLFGIFLKPEYLHSEKDKESTSNT